MVFSSAPENLDEFYRRLGGVAEGLPKRLRQCSDCIVAHPDRVAVSTVAELAVSAGVQPSAFMRFCQELGFSGFSEMQKLFRAEYTQKWPDYKARLVSLQERGADSASALLSEFVDAGISSIENLAQTIDPWALDRAVDVLRGANTIHIAGFRRALPVASYLSYAFEKMGVRSILHSGVGGLNFDHMLAEGDALIAITFSSYSAETVALAHKSVIKEMGLVAITDVPTSPLAQLGEVNLFVSEIDVGAFRTLTATMSLALALAVSVGQAEI